MPHVLAQALPVPTLAFLIDGRESLFLRRIQKTVHFRAAGSAQLVPLRQFLKRHDFRWGLGIDYEFGFPVWNSLPLVHDYCFERLHS